MKPIYSLTPISDHAKDLLAAIDNKKIEPAYTDKHTHSLDSMYGANKAKLDRKDASRYSQLVHFHLLVTKDNIEQLSSDSFIAFCTVDFETPDLYEICIKKGIKFVSCVLYPNGVDNFRRSNSNGEASSHGKATD